MMDRSVYNMKAEKIQKQVKQGDYETAARICDGINWTQVTSTRMLSLVSNVYEHVQQYDKAIDILLMAYENAPKGRRFLYKLTELSLAAGDIKKAEEYYRGYLEEAGDDNSRYILRYLIAEAKREPIDKRIAILEAYKSREFDECWSCRLAELYDMAGQTGKCLDACDEIILWFGVGSYVDKAYELKRKHGRLTPEQEERMQVLNADYEEPEHAASESGQAVSALDTSVIRDEQEQPEQENAVYSTRKISDKDDFNHTRLFEKLPAEGAERKLFRTIHAGKAPQTEPSWNAGASEAGTGSEEEPYQMRLNLDGQEASKIVFLGTDAPSVAMEMAAGKLEEVHRNYGEPMKKAVKITGAKLNERGILASLPLLDGRDMIVLGASALADEVLQEMKPAVESTGMIIILADSRDRISELEERYNSRAEALQEEEMTEVPDEYAAQDGCDEPAEQPEDYSEEYTEEYDDDSDIKIALTETEELAAEQQPGEAGPGKDRSEEDGSEDDRSEEDKVAEGSQESLTPEQFYACVRDYMRAAECVLEPGADSGLLDYFKQLYREGAEFTAELAGNMVEDAADLAQGKKGAMGMFHRDAYDDDGYLILRLKHFTRQ